MKRFYSYSRFHSFDQRTNLFGILTLVSLLIALLLYFTNQMQQEKIVSSFCGDFGFYGKTLVLMKDNTFRFHYHGCSQVNGYLSGKWTQSQDHLLTLNPETPDVNLQDVYKITDDRLEPMNTEGEGFTLCEMYVGPWGRNE